MKKLFKISLVFLAGIITTSCQLFSGGMYGDCGSKKDLTSGLYIGSEWRKTEADVTNDIKTVLLKIDAEVPPGSSLPDKFELSSSNPLKMFFDTNNNGEIDTFENKYVYYLTTDPIEIDWVSISLGAYPAQMAGPCVWSETKENEWKIQADDGFVDGTVITLHSVTKGDLADQTPKTVKINVVEPIETTESSK